MLSNKRNVYMKKEKYIREKNMKKGICFEVYFKYYDSSGKRQTYSNSFHVNHYGSKSLALKAAVADRDKMRNMLNTTGIKVKHTPTLKEVYEEKKRIFIFSEETNRKYDLLFRNYLYDLSDVPIDKIKAKDIAMSLNKMIYKSQDEINRLFGLWKKIYHTAIMNDYVYADLTMKVTAPVSEKVEKPKDVSMTCSIDEVFDALMNYGYSEYIKYNCKVLAYAFRINYYLGLRPAELFALTKNDFDLVNKLVNIDKSIGTRKSDKSPDTNRPDKVIKKTKTISSIRKIPLPDACINDVIEVFKFARYEHIFKRYDGELMDSGYYSTLVLNASKKAGIKFNAYMLRHNYATELTLNKVDLRTIQELMGHTSGSMTLSYARSTDEAKRDAVNMSFRKKEEMA